MQYKIDYSYNVTIDEDNFLNVSGEGWSIQHMEYEHYIDWIKEGIQKYLEKKSISIHDIKDISFKVHCYENPMFGTENPFISKEELNTIKYD